jgi:5-deoxy-D-glucuronate isomerase
MQSTMEKYGEGITAGRIDPLVQDDGRISGLLLDPRRPEVPLELLGFGIYRLERDFIGEETKEREMVLVPQTGAFEIEIDGKRFTGARQGGPFAPGPGKSNASAVYVPRNARLRIRGSGEMAFFTAPALGDKPPFYLPPEAVTVISRGEWIWRRDIVSLIGPGNASTNLVVGETYSPPGYWSGTPLHRHDCHSPSTGESDHEEIYYHRFSWQKGGADEFGPYGVQLLMDGERLRKAFLLTNRSIFAIPGGCHPVVASPVSALLYLWALAGRNGEVRMKDIPEFAHLKSFERIFHELDGEGSTKKTITRAAFDRLCAAEALTAEQVRLLEEMVKERGQELI